MKSNQSINYENPEERDNRNFFQKFKWVIIFGITEVLILVLYFLFTEYSDDTSPLKANTKNDEAKDKIYLFYPLFQDIHVMIFIGFGFLMTFLKTHSWTSVGLNYFVAAWAIQVVILFSGFWTGVFKGFDQRISLDIKSLIEGDFGAAAVLISFGAVLGKFNPVQMIVLTTIEMAFYSLNSFIGTTYLKAVDMGGSMYIHTFGAYFGLAVAFWSLENRFKSNKNNGSSYNSNLFAFIGTIFLWMYWPSFNGAMAEGVTKQRVLVNTYLSMTGSCIIVFILNPVFRNGKLSAESILNATLAGGVIIGTVSDLVTTSWEAILIGVLGGAISLFGFEKLSAFISNKFNIYDTCGINNLHGLPGVVSGILGGVYASFASTKIYGDSLENIFPALKDGRSSGEQGLFQLAGLGLSLLFALIGGTISGLIVRSELFDKPSLLFTDREFWDIEGIEIADGYEDVRKDEDNFSDHNKKVSENKIIDAGVKRNSNISDKNNSQKVKLLS